jgi:hypothetical protein
LAGYSRLSEEVEIDAFARLRQFQLSLGRDVGEVEPEDIPHLSVTEADGLLHVGFYGSPYEDRFSELCSLLAEAEVAEVLASVWLRGPDEGANGTRTWDVTGFVDGAPGLPVLRSFHIEQTTPTDHNQSIVAELDGYDEGGVLARLVGKSPLLNSLTAPSAPNAEFFEVGDRPLFHLNVDAGYDHQDFIRNLARSTCYANLGSLEFGEFHAPYVDNYQERCTPLADYYELFSSGAMTGLKRFVWRNPACTPDEIVALRAGRSDLQFMVVRTSAEYV